MSSFPEEYYASNDETKCDSLDCRESYSSRLDIFYCMIYKVMIYSFLSMESTPSDFDESTSERFRVMTEKELLQEYISLLNKMNDDLVFGGEKSLYELHI